MNLSAYETQTEPDCGSDPQGLEWAKEQLLDPAHLCCGHGQDSGFSPLSSGSLAGQREERDTDFKVKRISQAFLLPHVRQIPPAPCRISVHLLHWIFTKCIFEAISEICTGKTDYYTLKSLSVLG